jgi:hypothetical protein
MNLSWSRIIAIVAALGAALAGIATYLDEINPKYGILATIVSTFIAIFCERVQGGKSTIASILLIATICSFSTGCPASSVKKAAKTSYQFAGLVNDLSKATDQAYDEGLLSLGLKDAAVVSLKKLNAGSKSFNGLVTAMAASNAEPSPSEVAALSKLLSDEVVAPFLNLLKDLGAIAAEKAAYLRDALSALRIAILTIAQAVADNGGRVDIGGLSNA